jgi:hypothetical protein
MLPLLAGLPLLAAWTLERRLLDAPRARTLTHTFVLFLLPVHLILLVWAMVRWQRGLPGGVGAGWFDPLAGDWHPPTGSLPPLMIMVFGLLLTAVLGWVVPHEDTQAAGEVPSQRELRSDTWRESRLPGADAARGSR